MKYPGQGGSLYSNQGSVHGGRHPGKPDQPPLAKKKNFWLPLIFQLSQIINKIWHMLFLPVNIEAFLYWIAQNPPPPPPPPCYMILVLTHKYIRTCTPPPPPPQIPGQNPKQPH